MNLLDLVMKTEFELDQLALLQIPNTRTNNMWNIFNYLYSALYSVTFNVKIVMQWLLKKSKYNG